MYNHFRNMSTTNERRAASDPEIKDLIRPARKYSSLPNSWDDINRGRKKVSTYRQIRRATNKYRESIRFM